MLMNYLMSKTWKKRRLRSYLLSENWRASLAYSNSSSRAALRTPGPAKEDGSLSLAVCKRGVSSHLEVSELNVQRSRFLPPFRNGRSPPQVCGRNRWHMTRRCLTGTRQSGGNQAGGCTPQLKVSHPFVGDCSDFVQLAHSCLCQQVITRSCRAMDVQATAN